jgi:hypothetical protein
MLHLQEEEVLGRARRLTAGLLANSKKEVWAGRQCQSKTKVTSSSKLLMTSIEVNTKTLINSSKTSDLSITSTLFNSKCMLREAMVSIVMNGSATTVLELYIQPQTARYTSVMTKIACSTMERKDVKVRMMRSMRTVIRSGKILT